jgi:chemotaxis protein CheX
VIAAKPAAFIGAEPSGEMIVSTTAAEQKAADSKSALDTKLIAPFGVSVVECFQRMLGVKVTLERPAVRESRGAPFDISGIVGYSGDITGNVVLSFSREAGIGLVNKFAGCEIDPDSTDFADGIGEFANWVVGAAKAKFNGDISMSTPAVIIGNGHQLAKLSDVPCIGLPCRCEFGPFALDVNVKRT